MLLAKYPVLTSQKSFSIDSYSFHATKNDTSNKNRGRCKSKSVNYIQLCFIQITKLVTDIYEIYKRQNIHEVINDQWTKDEILVKEIFCYSYYYHTISKYSFR